MMEFVRRITRKLRGIEMTKIRNGELDEVSKALADLGANRMTYEKSVEVADVAAAVDELIRERERKRTAIVKPYLPEGEERMDQDHPDFPEAAERVERLFGEEVELEFSPVVAGKAVRRAEVRANSIRILRHFGILVPEADPDDPDADDGDEG